MPFITEEIWQRVAPLAGVAGDSIMLAPWPRADDFAADAAAESELRWIMQAVLGIRQIRGEMDIAPSRRVPLLLQQPTARDLQLVERHQALMAHLAALASVRALAPDEQAPPAAAAIVRRTDAAGTDGGVDRAGQRAAAAREARAENRAGTAPIRAASSPTIISCKTRRPRLWRRSASVWPTGNGSATRSTAPYRAGAQTALNRMSNLYAPPSLPSSGSSSARARRCACASPACSRAATC